MHSYSQDPATPRGPGIRRQPGAYLITGGAGFIGSALVRSLLADGQQVCVVDDLSRGARERLPNHPALTFIEGDVRTQGLMQGLLIAGPAGGGCWKSLVHLAARVGVRTVLEDPEGCRRENLEGVEVLIVALAAMPREMRPRVLFASTSEVYEELRAPLSESDPLRSIAGVGRWAYAASKLEGEHCFDAAAHLWEPQRGAIHLRFFNVVGPGQDAGSGMVLPTFVEQVLAGQAITVHHDGAMVRTLAHVDEVAELLNQLAIRAALEDGGILPGALNIGGSAVTSVLALAECLAETARREQGLSVRVHFVDPLRTLSKRFEEVGYREPSLNRARGFGLPLPQRGLAQIVADSLARHADLALPGSTLIPLPAATIRN